MGGRTALLRPGVQIEQLLLPGAMALLHQVCRLAGAAGLLLLLLLLLFQACTPHGGPAAPAAPSRRPGALAWCCRCHRCCCRCCCRCCRRRCRRAAATAVGDERRPAGAEPWRPHHPPQRPLAHTDPASLPFLHSHHPAVPPYRYRRAASCVCASYRPQVRRYDLVIQLSEEGAGLGARQIQDSSPHTLREIEQDMALATALAQASGAQPAAAGAAAILSSCHWLCMSSRPPQPPTCWGAPNTKPAPASHAPPGVQCGLADRALKEGQPALACSRLEEALELLVGAPHAAGGGSLLGEGGPGAQQGQRALAPKLQAEIRAALAQYHPDAVADYLQAGGSRGMGCRRGQGAAGGQAWHGWWATAGRGRQEWRQGCGARRRAAGQQCGGRGVGICKPRLLVDACCTSRMCLPFALPCPTRVIPHPSSLLSSLLCRPPHTPSPTPFLPHPSSHTPPPTPLLPRTQVPLDRADYDLRQKELQALTAWAAEAPPPRRWLSRARRQRPALTADYMARIVPHLTAGRPCGRLAFDLRVLWEGGRGRTQRGLPCGREAGGAVQRRRCGRVCGGCRAQLRPTGRHPLPRGSTRGRAVARSTLQAAHAGTYPLPAPPAPAPALALACSRAVLSVRLAAAGCRGQQLPLPLVLPWAAQGEAGWLAGWLVGHAKGGMPAGWWAGGRQ